MKNTIKKLVFIITIVFLSVSLAGCSTKTPTSQETIDKYTEALKNIKSETYNSDVMVKDTLRKKYIFLIILTFFFKFDILIE